MISLKSPKKSDIIIFDECNLEYIKPLISENYSITVINQRPPVYYINLRIIIVYIYYLLKHKFKFSFKNFNEFVISFFKELRLVYYRSVLSIINPNAVITMIDNNEIFNSLSERIKNTEFISIQNGLRLPNELKKIKVYSTNHLFSFGLVEKNYYKKFGIKVDNFYPSGSLIASNYINNINLKNRYDILLISNWRGNIGYNPEVEESMMGMQKLDRLFSKYVKENNIKAAIIMRNERDKQHWYMPEIGKTEEEYFKDIYGSSVDLYETNFNERNVYKLIMNSSLIIGISSTVLIEAYGIGRKIMYYNFNKSYNDMSILLNNMIISNNSDYDLFAKELNSLLSIDQIEYEKKHKKNMKYFMNYPNDISTNEYISKKIDQILKSVEK